MKFKNLTSFSYENLALLIIPLFLVLVLRIFGFDGLYGQDAYEYLRYTDAIHDYFATKVHPGNYYWPVLYPFLGSLLGFIFGNVIALQLISCLSFSGACIYVLKTIRLLYPKTKSQNLYVFIFAIFCPFLLKMGLIIMSDALGLLFVTCSIFYFFKSYFKETSLAPVFVFATCALMTRYASIFITLPLIVGALYLVVKRKKYQQFFTAVILSLVVSTPFVIFQWGALFNATSNNFLQVWSIMNYFKSTFISIDGTQHYTFPNIIYICFLFFHPGFIFIGGILSLFALKDYKSLFTFHQLMLICCISMYILFLGGIPFQNPRILGLVFPLVLILFFPAFNKMMKIKMIERYKYPLMRLCVGLQLLFFIMTFQLTFSRSIIEKEIAQMIKPYEGKTLYSFDVDLAMQGRGLNFDYKNMYLSQYQNLSKNDLILFDVNRHKKQWKGKNPMLNWTYFSQNYKLKVLEGHPAGWKLYQVQ